MSATLRCLAFLTVSLSVLLAAASKSQAEESKAWVERSRRVLVLYGWDRRETEKAPMVPADTMSAELLQAPIEWLGYECEYLDVGNPSPLPEHAAGHYAAVILDGELQIPAAKELATVRWLGEMRRSNLPVLFLGGIPFGSEEALRLLRETFGLRGSLVPTPQVHNVTIAVTSDTLQSAEAKASPRSHDFRDLQAPEDAQVLLGLAAQNSDNQLVRFTPIFTADWGGVWLEPYVTLRASQDSQLFYADPWKLMATFLSRRGPMPAPDTTTRDGLRLFYSHIDGDGFASPSDFKGHPLCGEMVRDRVLKVFPFPVTASVVEADMRAWSEGLEDSQQEFIANTARSIFALPNVQVASHSFSHPYLWFKEDPNPGEYTEPNLALKPVANYPEIVADREIRGSIDYIQKSLCPPGKRVELMLWSGNCRPGEYALRVCRELGIENMNGGDTIVSRLYPGIAGIAPRVTQWGSELQINAANQNEFMYANGWNGPFYGGFARVIDTFERTESPRRVKPVNVYYHFYSAMNMSALRALEKIYHWCQEQALHPVTALQFAQMTRDAFHTRIFEGGPRRWLIENDGHLRTFRLPASAGVPDMKRCAGVTGWTTLQDSLYVHTRGDKRTELVLTNPITEPVTANDAHLRLVTSDAEIAFDDLKPLTTHFTTSGIGEAVVEFAGLPAKEAVVATINGTVQRLTANERGHLTLNLPATSRVELDATGGRNAAVGN